MNTNIFVMRDLDFLLLFSLPYCFFCLVFFYLVGCGWLISHPSEEPTVPVPVDPSESLADAVCCDKRTKATLSQVTKRGTFLICFYVLFLRIKCHDWSFFLVAVAFWVSRFSKILFGKLASKNVMHGLSREPILPLGAWGCSWEQMSLPLEGAVKKNNPEWAFADAFSWKFPHIKTESKLPSLLNWQLESSI